MPWQAVAQPHVAVLLVYEGSKGMTAEPGNRKHVDIMVARRMENCRAVEMLIDSKPDSRLGGRRLSLSTHGRVASGHKYVNRQLAAALEHLQGRRWRRKADGRDLFGVLDVSRQCVDMNIDATVFAVAIGRRIRREYRVMSQSVGQPLLVKT